MITPRIAVLDRNDDKEENSSTGLAAVARRIIAGLAATIWFAMTLSASPQAQPAQPDPAQTPTAEPQAARKMPSLLADKPNNNPPKPEPRIVLQKTDADFQWVDAAAHKSPPFSANRHKDCNHMQDQFLIAERKKARKGLGAKLKGLYEIPDTESLSARINEGQTNQQLFEICLAYDPQNPATLQNGTAVAVSAPSPKPDAQPSVTAAPNGFKLASVESAPAPPVPVVTKPPEVQPEPVSFRRLGSLSSYTLKYEGREYLLIPEKFSIKYDGPRYSEYTARKKNGFSNFNYIVKVDPVTHALDLSSIKEPERRRVNQ